MIRSFKEEGVSSLCFNVTSFFANKNILYLIGLFSNIYLTLFDNFFFEILLIFGKRGSGLQKSTFFLYQNLFDGGGFISNKYLFKYSKFFVFFLFHICIKYFRFCDTVLFGTVSSFNFILLLKIKIIHFFKFSLFLNSCFIGNFNIKNFFQGFSFLGFCLKKKKFFIHLYIEKKQILEYLMLKGFCNKTGFPLPCFKYILLTQSLINKKINFLINLCFLWFFESKNLKKILKFIIFIVKYSVSKLYSSKFKKNSVSNIYALSGNNFNILI